MNTLDVQIEERSGRYGDINEYFVNDKTYTNTFAKISKIMVRLLKMVLTNI